MSAVALAMLGNNMRCQVDASGLDATRISLTAKQVN
jgi:hypothetical protein